MNTKKRMDRCSHRPATRIASLILSFAMLFTLTVGLDFSAFADASSGTCGENVTWSFDENTGKLTISGNGPMDDFQTGNSVPWINYRFTLKSVDIEDGITRIGNRAFIDFSEIVNVTIPDSVESIGKYAFAHCDRIADITIPDSVKSLGNYAFENCYSIKNIVLPDGLTEISEGLFSYCQNLESIIIPESVITIGDNAFEECAFSRISIPNGVTSIGEDAFKGCNIMALFIPESVININDRAFYDCTFLTRVIISDGLKSIGDSAFNFCPSLCDVYYTGSEQQFRDISRGDNNANLFFSDFHYNVTEPEFYMFFDLDGFEYYCDYVKYTSVFNDFILGTNSPHYTYFHPFVSITRAMFVTILYRMAGEPYANNNPYSSSPFTDITDTSVYYYDAACWALKNGITTETTFKPFDNVTREQTASFLFRYAKDNNQLGCRAYKNVDLSKYSDNKNISSWAIEPMQWANYNGMITGTQQGYANPQGATQRIHATKILYGFGKVCNIGDFA